MSEPLYTYRKELADYQVNEICPEVIGFHARNPAATSNSPSRNTMYSGHASQCLVIKGIDIPHTLSATEVEYSKYTTSDRVPFDAQVVQVIDRYPPGISANSLAFNPERMVIIVNEETGMYDVIPVCYYKSLHQYFGYKNSIADIVETMPPGTRLAKDSVLGDTPGNIGRFHSMTANVNCMLASPDVVAEDSVLICEDELEKFEYRVYERRSFSVGHNKFPVNIGRGNEYKGMYDIGEYTDEDGAIVFLRDYIDGLAPVTMSRSSTRTVNYAFDEAIYARQGKRGRIVDIKVTGNADTVSMLPEQMTVQFEKYRQAYIRFNEELLACEHRIRKESHRRFGTDEPHLSNRLHSLFVTARAICDGKRPNNDKPLQGTLNKSPLDQYHVEVVIEYVLRPTIGSKLTSVSGDKGIITQILPRHRMPIDKDGNVAGIVMASDGTVARTNYARQYLMHVGAFCVKMDKRLTEITGLRKDSDLESVEYLDKKVFDRAWDFLIGGYECINPDFARIMDSFPMKDKILHVWECLEVGVRLVRPIDCKKPWPHAIMDMENYLPICWDTLDHQLITDGKTETTRDKIMIGAIPVMVLDKTAEDTLTVAIAAHGPFGILVKHNKADKHRMPWKDSPARTLGESEYRTYIANTKDPEMAADMMDRANNPAVQLEIARKFVGSLTPGNIDSLIDRTKFDYGNTRPLGIISNFFQAYGFKMKYIPENQGKVPR